MNDSANREPDAKLADPSDTTESRADTSTKSASSNAHNGNLCDTHCSAADTHQHHRKRARSPSDPKPDSVESATLMADTLPHRDQPSTSSGSPSVITSRPGKKPRLTKLEDKSVAPPPVYYFENGLRRVRPYWQTFKVYTKGRWIGRRLEEVLTTEFNRLQREQYVRMAVKMGRIKVNDQQVTADYVLKSNDLIWHRYHRHERAVSHLPIRIVQQDDEVVVVDKPPSIPVHPCGAYSYNTVIKVLQYEHNITELKVVHRLDRNTSGCLILAKTKAADQLFSRIFRDREIHKQYLAKVDGEFPDGEIVVDKPIEAIVPAMGIQIIDEENGKPTLTRFKRVWTDGKQSVVSCYPETGRTHQIRVHLQYLGYPIDNDYIYNCDAFGPVKGKLCDYGGMTREQLRDSVTERHSYLTWLVKGEMNEPPYELRDFAQDKEIDESNPVNTAEERDDYDPYCVDCHVNKIDPSGDALMMHLHCLKYYVRWTDSWSCESDWPDWAKQSNDTETGNKADVTE